MGNHIHFKEGKYAIWSTVVDKYTTEWTDDETWITSVWIQMATYRALNNLKELLKNAKAYGCSVRKPMACSKDQILQVGEWKK